MLFWMACEELKKEANKNIIEEKARIIYEDYISILSPKEVCAHKRVFSLELLVKLIPSVFAHFHHMVIATPRYRKLLCPD